MICFVGVPGSGKTWLAKKIEKQYNGVRINNDLLRKIIDKKITKKEEEREEILKEFLSKFLKQYAFKNKLVILDSGIERKYETIKEIADKKNIEIFIIKMVVPKKMIIQRIKKKDEKRFGEHPEHIRGWFEDYNNFKINPDFIFKENSLPELFLKLDKMFS